VKKINKINKLIIVLVLSLFSTILLAQNNLNQKKENKENRKIAFFTAKMNLNKEEAQNFWPVLNEMEAELKNLRKENIQGKMIIKDKKAQEISDKELEELLDARIQIGKKQMEIKVKYHEKFKEVLPIRKVAKFYQANKEFKKIQSERKKQHNNPGERKR
jgi:Na+-transporting NADH:ubiquinone oxidoreductase subunit NqrC